MKINRRDFLFASSTACLLAQNVKPSQAQTRRPTAAPKSFSAEGRQVAVYTTAEKTDYRPSATDTLTFKHLGQPLETQVCVFVDPSKTYQTLLGIGGAITDAAAETFARLPEEKQREMLEAYYDPRKGIGYTFARTKIHSCDFSSESYTYVAEGDRELKTFSVARHRRFRIPLINRARATGGGKLTIFASPWSPPAFMKDNNDMLHGGKLRPEFYQAWANYYAKFIKAYQSEGVPVWGVTVKNETMATRRWES